MSRYLEEMAGIINDLGINTLRIAEMRPGCEPEVLDLKPATICCNSYSSSKFFTAAAIGFLYDRGLVRTDERIVDILKDFLPKAYDRRWDLMTVDMALRHFCGFKPGYLDIDVADLTGVTGGDFLGYLFDTALECDPGTTYCYSDAAFYLLSRVVSAKIGGTAMDTFLWKELFLPLGFREAAWSRCPHGYAMGATGLYIYTGDLVKLPMLYMNGGLWKGKRLLSESWIKLSLERSYGLNMYPNGAYGKGGMLGQLTAAIPSQNRCVAWHSVNNADMNPLQDWVFSRFHN